MGKCEQICGLTVTIIVTTSIFGEAGDWEGGEDKRNTRKKLLASVTEVCCSLQGMAMVGLYICME